MLLQTSTSFPKIRESVPCSLVKSWDETCLSTQGLYLFAYVAAWCNLENVIIVSISLSLKVKAELFQRISWRAVEPQALQSQLRGACSDNANAKTFCRI